MDILGIPFRSQNAHFAGRYELNLAYWCYVYLLEWTAFCNTFGKTVFFANFYDKVDQI